MQTVLDDLALLEAWAAGDRAAAATLLERHLEPVTRFFRGKVRGDVDDFIQETFTRCFARRAGLAPDSSFRAYLFAVARNLLYEHIRKSTKQSALAPEMSIQDLAPTPSAVLHRGEEHRLMAQAMHMIPIDSQLALELYYWEDLGVAEIAHVLEIPVGTVKSRLHRARGQLRSKLEALASGSPHLQSTLSQIDDWTRSRDPT